LKQKGFRRGKALNIMENSAFEIQTLLHSNQDAFKNDISSIIASTVETEDIESHPRWRDYPAVLVEKSFEELYGPRPKNVFCGDDLWTEWIPIAETEQCYSADDEKSSEVPGIKETDLVVKGEDIKDLPTCYTVRGIKPFEFPVIGTYVDLAIVPGFRYKVRLLGADKFLFGGKANFLQSVGQGYGKRLTFRGETLNRNSNYFWSDTDPDGYGFSLQVLDPEDEFEVYSEEEQRPVAMVTTESVHLQNELSTQVVEGSIEKRVAVSFTAEVKYSAERHGLLSLRSTESLQLAGVAVLLKERGHRFACLDHVEVNLPTFGPCIFYLKI